MFAQSPVSSPHPPSVTGVCSDSTGFVTAPSYFHRHHHPIISSLCSLFTKSPVVCTQPGHRQPLIIQLLRVVMVIASAHHLVTKIHTLLAARHHSSLISRQVTCAVLAFTRSPVSHTFLPHLSRHGSIHAAASFPASSAHLTGIILSTLAVRSLKICTR